MGPRTRKALILPVKLSVTAGMIWWVLSGVHWHDYVVDAGGGELRVLGRRDGQVLVPAARLSSPKSDGAPGWRDLTEFQPLGGQAIRPGMRRALSGIRPWTFALGAGLIALQLVLMGIRWGYLLGFRGLEVGYRDATRLMFVGHFFNFFLPGATGGDVVRAVLVTRRAPRQKTVAVATVLLDRFVGLAGMAVLAGLMTAATWGDERTRRAGPAVAATLAILVAAAAVLFSRRVGRLIRLDALIERLPWREHLRWAMETLRSLPRSGRATALVAAMTIGVHVLLAAGIACMGSSLDLPVPAGLYFVFVPVIYILAAIPISVGGLGLVEGMYVVFFAASGGVDVSAVVALSLLARFTPMALSLPGLAFWLAERSPRAAPPHDGMARTGEAV